MIILGIILIALGTYVIHMADSGSKMEEQNSLKEEIRLRDSTIKEQAQIINDNITGGNSFCFLLFQKFSEEDVVVQAHHKGDKVLRNVVITITDEFARVKEAIDFNNSWPEDSLPGKRIIESMKNIKKHVRVIPIGNIIPNKESNVLEGRFNTTLDFLHINSNDTIFWDIEITADNGIFYQKYKSIPLEDGRVHATVTKDAYGNVLQEKVHPQFPRTSAGNIIWNDY